MDRKEKMENKKKMKKYEEIMTVIQSDIESKKLLPGGKLPTEKELCSQFSTSMITVVKALSELKNKGIIVRVRGSGSYVKDNMQPQLLEGKRLSLAVLWHSHIEPASFYFSFFGLISQGILEGAGLKKDKIEWLKTERKNNVVGNITSEDRSVSIDFISESIESQTRHPNLKEMLAKNYNSFITLGIKSEAWLDELLSLNVPTVLIDLLSDKYNYLADQVFIDPHPAFNQLFDYFQKSKITKIHFVLGYTSIPAPSSKMKSDEVAKFRNRMMMVDPDSQFRFNIFKRIAEERGLEIKNEWVHSCQPMDYTNEDIAKKISDMPLNDQPEAIVCPSIGAAEAMMKYFYQRNKKVFCAGVTNDKYNGPVTPLHVYCENMGLVGLELLLSKIQRPKRVSIRAGVPMALLLEGSKL